MTVNQKFPPIVVHNTGLKLDLNRLIVRITVSLIQSEEWYLTIFEYLDRVRNILLEIEEFAVFIRFL